MDQEIAASVLYIIKDIAAQSFFAICAAMSFLYKNSIPSALPYSNEDHPVMKQVSTRTDVIKDIAAQSFFAICAAMSFLYKNSIPSALPYSNEDHPVMKQVSTRTDVIAKITGAI